MMIARYDYYVIQFLVIIFDEKVYDIKVFSTVLSYLKFHDFRDSFCRKRHAFLKKVNHIFSYIRFNFVQTIGGKVKDQSGRIKKNNGLFMPHLSLKCSN